MTDVLAALARILEERKTADPSKSYVAKLYQGGLDGILKKVGEEATEVVIAAKSGDAPQILHEIADLWFHTMVVMAYCGIEHDAVLAELARRFGVSGLEEKASRLE